MTIRSLKIAGGINEEGMKKIKSILILAEQNKVLWKELLQLLYRQKFYPFLHPI